MSRRLGRKRTVKQVKVKQEETSRSDGPIVVLRRRDGEANQR